MDSSSRLRDLMLVVRQIPLGAAAGYGTVGKCLVHPVSGLLAGRWMHGLQDPDCPWWRVVGSDGSLLIARKSAELALEQRRRLESEGVEFNGDRVESEFILGYEELWSRVASAR